MLSRLEIDVILSKRAAEPGILFVVATPIGNLGDITLRALEVLRSVDVIAAEDTRHTRKLLTHFNIHKPLLSYHAHNFQSRGVEVLEQIRNGKSFALVTDAGTPGISDPGAFLVHQAVEQSLPVTVIPGPTALITALVTSGLPTHPFAFLGFPPAKGTGRRRFFDSLARLPMTLILYESPQRLVKTLQDLLQVCGNRPMAVARELTKQYEEVFRGTVMEGIGHFADGARGEATLVIAGHGKTGEGSDLEKDPEDSESSWIEPLRKLMREPGISIKEATERIAKIHGVARRTVYREALRLKEEP